MRLVASKAQVDTENACFTTDSAMTQPTSPFSSGLPIRNPFAMAAQAAIRSPGGISPAAPSSQTPRRHNPFLTAMDPDSEGFKTTYGVNQPMPRPMFLGYRDDQPIFGGSRLFILY